MSKIKKNKKKSLFKRKKKKGIRLIVYYVQKINIKVK